jgi:dCMP deaminase
MDSRGRIDKISWWLLLAELASARSEDPWCKVGAIGVRKDGSIAGVSYNGAPPKIEIDWSNRDERRKYVVHAETNLLRYIKPHECPTIITTISPCFDCLKNLASYGVKEIYFKEYYDKCDKKELQKMAELFNIDLYQCKQH